MFVTMCSRFHTKMKRFVFTGFGTVVTHFYSLRCKIWGYCSKLPAKMCECLIRLSHFVGVKLFLDGGTGVFVSFHDLSGKFIG